MITAKQAILKECQDCCGTVQFRSMCSSPNCALSEAREFKSSSSVKRIKTHCLECCPEKTIHGVKDCDGKLIGGVTGDPRICHLHPFREGKNPFKPKRAIPETQKQLLLTHRFVKNVRGEASVERKIVKREAGQR
jgi:hypothetical protein